MAGLSIVPPDDVRSALNVSCRRPPATSRPERRGRGGCVIPILSVLACTVLMLFLTVETWLRFLIWMLLGLVVYFLYSRHHSRLGRGEIPIEPIPE